MRVLSAKRESHATLLLFSLPVHPRVKLMPKRTAGGKDWKGKGGMGREMEREGKGLHCWNDIQKPLLMLTFTFTLTVFPSTCLRLGYCYCVSLYFLFLFLPMYLVSLRSVNVN